MFISGNEEAPTWDETGGTGGPEWQLQALSGRR